MILTCSHNGIGSPSEIDLRSIGPLGEIISGDLHAVLDHIVEAKSGRARRGYHSEMQDRTTITVTCACGLSLRADFGKWLGYCSQLKAAGVERVDLLAAKRQYQRVVHTLGLSFGE